MGFLVNTRKRGVKNLFQSMTARYLRLLFRGFNFGKRNSAKNPLFVVLQGRNGNYVAERFGKFKAFF